MKDKIILFDADSLIYQAIYKVVSFGEFREMIEQGLTRIQIESEILHRGFERFEKIAFDIFNEIEQEYNITEVRYFFTTCVNNFRYEFNNEYKANRKGKRNKYVNMLREHLVLNLDGALASDVYEADDLIYYNTQILSKDEWIICSIDKDMRQIAGIHFDYYQQKKYDEDGNEYKVRKGFNYVSELQAENLIFEMLLTGDVSDNIKGIHGIGKVKANKIIKDKTRFGKLVSVCREWAKHEPENWKIMLSNNIKQIVFN